ncbi:MAG: sigma-54-dependent Fis family transcriptional regulator [Gemmatimonadota bacterium]|nr:MAG: sigma-54-dependent Fis family transcriptional regulator [Gemmatimonadota bacterium]
MMSKILVVDDEQSIRDSLKIILEYEKYGVVLAADGQKALRALEGNDIDVVLLDIKMPGMDGLEVLQEIKQRDPHMAVVIISGHGTISTAVEATKLGAFDFLEKPLDRDRLLLTIRNGLAQRRLTDENIDLRKQISRHDEIIGRSRAIQEILATIQKVGPTQARILITGENGTGKELVAKAIHRSSPRKDGPFIEVNCAAIPTELIESELFGHEKGAFTGAVGRRIGKFELADGGTIFLDEIGDMSLSAQAKVLRVLEENRLQRIGGSQTIDIDVRVLAATNKDLLEEAGHKRFREDLYYRLNVVPLHLRPLRDRIEDIPLLVDHFLRQACEQNNVHPKAITPEALKVLQRHHWPGNIRELRNAVERVVILSAGETILEGDVEHVITGRGGASDGVREAKTFQDFKEQAEKQFLMKRLRENSWNISQTAQDLKMQRSNLYRKMEKYGLHPLDG